MSICILDEADEGKLVIVDYSKNCTFISLNRIFWQRNNVDIDDFFVRLIIDVHVYIYL